jgi:hypothetical protein
MMRRIRPTYAGVTSTLALFMALGGGAYAAASLPAHSVGPRQLKRNAVTSAAIKHGAVNGAKVANGSLTGADIRLSTLGKVPAAVAADSAASATNATNAVHAGAAAALDHVTYKTATGSATAGAVTLARVACDAGEHAIGGGIQTADPGNVVGLDDYPDSGNTAWTVHLINVGDADVGFTAYAICTAVAATS